MAGITPSSVKVYLNGNKLEVKNFSSYIDMYIDSEDREEEEVKVKKVYEKPNEYWEVKPHLIKVGMYISDGQFQQVSYANAICTSKGGTHVNYVADQVIFI
jgi:DNA topoisomerase-2